MSVASSAKTERVQLLNTFHTTVRQSVRTKELVRVQWLNEIEYVAYLRMHKGLSEEKAADQWKQDLTKGNIPKRHGRIAVAMPPETVGERESEYSRSVDCAVDVHNSNEQKNYVT